MIKKSLKDRMATIVYCLFLIIIFAVCYSGNIDTKKNYKAVKVGEGIAYIPVDYYNTSTRKRLEDYYYLETSECKMIIIDYPVNYIEPDILDKMGLSYDILSSMNIIESEYELQDVFDIEDSNVIKKGHTDRSSFQKYRVIYEAKDNIVAVYVYHEENRSVYQVIIADKEYFTEEEYKKMYSLLKY